MLQDKSNPSPLAAITSIVSAGLGLILIALGLWALGGAVFAAWDLYQDPASIAPFADYVLQTTKLTQLLKNGGESVAHLFSWIIVILLLLLQGKLGDWAISVGARLLKNTSRE